MELHFKKIIFWLNPQPFFSIMLVDGHLAVHINAGDRTSTRKVILQSANGTYSDGQEHSLILIRNKRYM